MLEGVVTLTGSVKDRWMKRRAEDIAASIGGVKDVENRIRAGTWRDQISDSDERTKPETD